MPSNQSESSITSGSSVGHGPRTDRKTAIDGPTASISRPEKWFAKLSPGKARSISMARSSSFSPSDLTQPRPFFARKNAASQNISRLSHGGEIFSTAVFSPSTDAGAT